MLNPLHGYFKASSFSFTVNAALKHLWMANFPLMFYYTREFVNSLTALLGCSFIFQFDIWCYFYLPMCYYIITYIPAFGNAKRPAF